MLHAMMRLNLWNSKLPSQWYVFIIRVAVFLVSLHSNRHPNEESIRSLVPDTQFSLLQLLLLQISYSVHCYKAKYSLFLLLLILQNYYTYIYLFICLWVGTLMTLPKVKARGQLVWIISLFYHVDPDIIPLPPNLILNTLAYWTISLCQKLHFQKIHLK